MGAAALGGWAFVTAGVAAVTSNVAWLFSAGVLLLSLCGFQLLWTVAKAGLYVLSRSGNE